MGKVLLFGATGMLGQAVQEVFATTNDFEVVALGSKECDITNLVAVDAKIREVQPQFIVNCAAYTAVDQAEDDEPVANALNHLAPQQMAQTARQTNATLIHISTDYVFDGSKSTPYTEADPTQPLGAYGRTKLAGEHAITATGCKHVVIRTQWLYSWRAKNFFLTMLRLFNTKTEIGVVSDQTGCPTYVGNLARAIVQVVKRRDEGDETNGIYQYSERGECTWWEFASAIAQTSATTCKVNAIRTADYPTRAVRPHYSVMSTEKLERDYAVSVPDWREGLNECWKEYKGRL